MFGIELSNVSSLLCLGAHSDDLEIGAGATVLRLAQENPDLEVMWVVFSAQRTREREARRAASQMLNGIGKQHVRVYAFADGYFPEHWANIKREFETIKDQFNPDLIITHSIGDKHQDHYTLGQLTWNTFREQHILEYEIPKYDGDLGQPNFFVHASPEIAQRKIEIIRDSFVSQSTRDWFDDATFMGLMRIRGLESRAPSKLAEAFHARKLICR